MVSLFRYSIPPKWLFPIDFNMKLSLMKLHRPLVPCSTRRAPSLRSLPAPHSSLGWFCLSRVTGRGSNQLLCPSHVCSRGKDRGPNVQFSMFPLSLCLFSSPLPPSPPSPPPAAPPSLLSDPVPHSCVLQRRLPCALPLGSTGARPSPWGSRPTGAATGPMTFPVAVRGQESLALSSGLDTAARPGSVLGTVDAAGSARAASFSVPGRSSATSTATHRRRTCSFMAAVPRRPCARRGPMWTCRPSQRTTATA